MECDNYEKTHEKHIYKNMRTGYYAFLDETSNYSEKEYLNFESAFSALCEYVQSLEQIQIR